MPNRSSAAWLTVAVARGRRRQQRAMRGAAHQHHGLHRERESARDAPAAHSRSGARALARTARRAAGPSPAPRRRARGIRPSSVFSSVVLPPPFGPSSASTSPCASRTLSPLPTRRSDNRSTDCGLRWSCAHDKFSRPCPAHAREQPDEERSADHRSENAERHLDRRHGARQRVDEQEKPAAENGAAPAAAARNPARPASAQDAAPPGRPSR